MSTTRPTLLSRVRDSGDARAWEEFYAIYAPILFRFSRSQGLPSDEAEEVRDQCLEVLARKIPSFDYDRQKGAFKSWLFRIARGKVIDQLRRRREERADTQELLALADPRPTPEEEWERNWHDEHLKYALEQARLEVSERSYRAFSLLLVHDQTVPQVCEALEMNPNQVYKSKMRVLDRVRQVLKRLEENKG